jgi:hypothetical protein
MEKPTGWAYKAGALDSATNDVYVVLKHRSKPETYLVMKFDTEHSFYRPVDIYGNLLQAGADDSWHLPLIRAVTGERGTDEAQQLAEQGAGQLRSVFRHYEHLVASIQLFPSVSTFWTLPELIPLRRFVLSHEWDGQSFRKLETEVPTIAYRADISRTFTNLREWASGVFDSEK